MKISRLGTYITGFKYYKNKIEITNSDELEKIKLLKIPPAYDNVTIINNKKIMRMDMIQKIGSKYYTTLILSLNKI